MVKKNLSIEKAGKTPSGISLQPSYQSESKMKIMETIMSVEERRERFDGYQLTGDFEKDVLELASVLGLPISVSQRVKTPLSTENPPGIGKHKDDKKSSVSSTETQEDDKSVDGDFTPTTFALSKCKDYFAPKLQIDPDTEAKGCVREIYLRGWLADNRIMDIMDRTFLPTSEKLSVLDFSNSGLTDETLQRLYDCIKCSPSLRFLHLDGNKFAKSQRFDVFLSQDDKLSLQHLSLKHCDINRTGAFHLGVALLENSSLQTLNLSYNKIDDKAAKNIGEGLKLNRSLVALNLGSNEIGDEGVKHVIGALTTFPLTHQQVVARRMLKSSNHEELEDDSGGRDKKNLSGKIPKRKDLQSAQKKDVKREKSASGMKTKTPKISSKGERVGSPLPDEDAGVHHPLLERVREVDGELWITGNRSLISLNLSRNNITDMGMRLLYDAMVYQEELVGGSTEHRGLLRLNVEKNKSVRVDDPVYLLLYEMMCKRDPFYKPPMDNVDEEG